MRLFFTSLLVSALPLPAFAAQVTASPNATMNDSLALGSKIDATAALAQAAYDALNSTVTALSGQVATLSGQVTVLSNQVSALTTSVNNLLASYNNMLSCSASLKFFNGSTCLNPPTGGGTPAPDPHLAAALTCMANGQLYNKNTGTCTNISTGTTAPDPHLAAALNCMANGFLYNKNTSSCVAIPTAGTPAALTGFLNRVWYNVASSRTYGASYANTNAWPMEVTFSGQGNLQCQTSLLVRSSPTAAEVELINSRTTHTDVTCYDGSNSCKKATCALKGTVPPGGSYRITLGTSSTPSILTWSELR